jgi:octaprenyl-diphosphate synthase
MEKGDEGERRMIRDAIESGGLLKLEEIREIIDRTGALAYTTASAAQAAEAAIDALAHIPRSEYKDALIAIAEFAVKRRS